MALDLTTIYPAQTEGDDDGYPHGKARNATSPNDGTGFPLERRWLNDLFGFQQALLDAAGIEPSGSPDEVGASDYLDALRAIVALPTARYVCSGSGIATGTTMTIAQRFADAGYVLDSGPPYTITLPSAGRFRFGLHGVMTCTSENSAPQFGAVLKINGGTGLDNSIFVRSYRFSDNALLSVPLDGGDVLEITDPANEKVTVEAFATNGNVSTSSLMLSIVRESLIGGS